MDDMQICGICVLQGAQVHDIVSSATVRSTDMRMFGQTSSPSSALTFLGNMVPLKFLDSSLVLEPSPEYTPVVRFNTRRVTRQITRSMIRSSFGGKSRSRRRSRPRIVPPKNGRSTCRKVMQVYENVSPVPPLRKQYSPLTYNTCDPRSDLTIFAIGTQPNDCS